MTLPDSLTVVFHDLSNEGERVGGEPRVRARYSLQYRVKNARKREEREP